MDFGEDKMLGMTLYDMLGGWYWCVMDMLRVLVLTKLAHLNSSYTQEDCIVTAVTILLSLPMTKYT